MHEHEQLYTAAVIRKDCCCSLQEVTQDCLDKQFGVFCRCRLSYIMCLVLVRGRNLTVSVYQEAATVLQHKYSVCHNHRKMWAGDASLGYSSLTISQSPVAEHVVDLCKSMVERLSHLTEAVT